MVLNPVEVNVEIGAVPTISETYSDLCILIDEDDVDTTTHDAKVLYTDIQNVEDAVDIVADEDVLDIFKMAFNQGVERLSFLIADFYTEESIDPEDIEQQLIDNDVDIITGPRIIEDTEDEDVAKDIAGMAADISAVYVAPLKYKSGEIADMKSFVEDDLNSKWSLAVAFDPVDEDDPIHAAITGKLSVIEPWDKFMWKEIEDVEIKQIPGDDLEELVDSQVNVLIHKLDKVLVSNGLTAANEDPEEGEDSFDEYRFIDIPRTEKYLVEEISSALERLIATSEITYTQGGLNTIESKIDDILSQANQDGAITDEYKIQIKDIDEISDEDKQLRKLEDISVEVQLAGRVQEIVMDLTINL